MSSLRVRRLTQRMAVVLACVSLSAVVSTPAAAAPDKEELSKARARFQQATELEQAGNWAAALQQFREVGQVRMTPQVRYHIALCEEKLGKLVAALGGFELALSEAESLGPDFHKEVEDKTNALRERIPKLVIERGEGAEAATIELDGVALGASSIGIEVPLDPGPHQNRGTRLGLRRLHGDGRSSRKGNQACHREPEQDCRGHDISETTVAMRDPPHPRGQSRIRRESCPMPSASVAACC